MFPNQWNLNEVQIQKSCLSSKNGRKILAHYILSDVVFVTIDSHVSYVLYHRPALTLHVYCTCIWWPATKQKMMVLGWQRSVCVCVCVQKFFSDKFALFCVWRCERTRFSSPDILLQLFSCTCTCSFLCSLQLLIFQLLILSFSLPSFSSPPSRSLPIPLSFHPSLFHSNINEK